MVIISFIYSVNDDKKRYFGKYIGRLTKEDIKSRLDTIVHSLLKGVNEIEIIQESWPNDSVDEFSYTENMIKMYELFYLDLNPPVIYLNGQFK